MKRNSLLHKLIAAVAEMQQVRILSELFAQICQSKLVKSKQIDA